MDAEREIRTPEHYCTDLADPLCTTIYQHCYVDKRVHTRLGYLGWNVIYFLITYNFLIIF
ncbi:MAG: hypothetical protein EU551_03940 [Promethearchaeota archaeon]|nr:MAG: hypothetical protein EU551_03940 [Candidatus Lokiarchaeota archaeon]